MNALPIRSVTKHAQVNIQKARFEYTHSAGVEWGEKIERTVRLDY